MMKPKHKRLIYIIALLAVLGGAVALVLNAFSDNLQFFFSPTDVVTNPPVIGKQIRLGGMVQAGSIQRDPKSLDVKFILTDFQNSTAVEYHGVLPDLFKENSGAVVIGHMRSDGVFAGETVLAKHDEKYMPPEVASSLKNKPGQ